MWFEKLQEHSLDGQRGKEFNVVLKTRAFDRRFGRGSVWDDTDLFLPANSDMLDILVAIGVYPSKQRAYQQGWRRYVPIGLSNRIYVGHWDKYEPWLNCERYLNIWNPRMFMFSHINKYK